MSATLDQILYMLGYISGLVVIVGLIVWFIVRGSRGLDKKDE